jgi:hypothetical protein
MADEDGRPSIAELTAIYREDDKRCLAITEAVPALLEIAAAGLKLDAAERALTAAMQSGRPHVAQRRETAACLAEWDAALAKVRP